MLDQLPTDLRQVFSGVVLLGVVLGALFLGMQGVIEAATRNRVRGWGGRFLTTGVASTVLVALMFITIREDVWPAQVGEAAILGLAMALSIFLISNATWWLEDAALDVLRLLFPLFTKMLRSAVALFALYGMIIVFFAIGFQSLYQSDSAAFRGVPSPLGGEFLFFSLTTITTVGLSSIQPASGLAKWLVSLEILSGIVWVVGVFGTFLAASASRWDAPMSATTDPSRAPDSSAPSS